MDEHAVTPSKASVTQKGRQRLLLLVDHSLDFLEFVSERGRVQSVSSAVTALAGYAPSDLVGKRFAELLHPQDVQIAANAFQQVLSQGYAGPVQLRYRHKNGSYRTVQVTARNFLADPVLKGILVLTRDVTAQIEAEAGLRQANTTLHRLTQRLLVAQELERGHLARELHDDVQQALAGLRYSMGASVQKGAGLGLAGLIRSWDATVLDVMELLRRLTLRLRPPALGQAGLKAAVIDYVAREQPHTPCVIEVDVSDVVGRLPPQTELAAFRIIQEALANVIKHARATHVRIRVSRAGGRLLVEIADDGAGFDVHGSLDRADKAGRIGLQSMCERARGVGGLATIASVPGSGTSIVADLPSSEAPATDPES